MNQPPPTQRQSKVLVNSIILSYTPQNVYTYIYISSLFQKEMYTASTKPCDMICTSCICTNPYKGNLEVLSHPVTLRRLLRSYTGEF